MTQKFIITGDVVEMITETTQADHYRRGGCTTSITHHGTVALGEFIQRLIEQQGQQSFIPALADGRIVAQKTKGGQQVVVVEFSPKIRRILECLDQGETRARQLAFPWVYLVVVFVNGLFSTAFLYYRNSAVESLEDELFCGNLPNVYADNHVCWADQGGLRTEWGLAQKLNWVITSFWDSVFNQHEAGDHWRPSTRLTGHPQSFTEWEQKSAENANFVLQIQWHKVGFSARRPSLRPGSQVEVSGGKSLQQLVDQIFSEPRY